jgi:hypothetical protein
MQHPKTVSIIRDPEETKTSDQFPSDTAAALALASKALDASGCINNSAIVEARNAGLSEDAIVDIIARVGLNAFT